LARALLETISVRVAQDCYSHSLFVRVKLVDKSYTQNNCSSSCSRPLKPVCLFLHEQRSLVKATPEQFQFGLLKTASQSVFVRAMLVGKSYTRNKFGSSCSRLQKPVCFTRAKLFGKSYTRNNFSSSYSRLLASLSLCEQFSLAKPTLDTISVRDAQGCNSQSGLHEQSSLVRATLETISVRGAQD